MTYPDARKPGRLEHLGGGQGCDGEKREAGEQSPAALADGVAEDLQALLALSWEFRSEGAERQGEQEAA
ncbi:MAG TPA: hypothetical protein VF951_13875 [Streptosporangiaceae bacterium]